MSHSGINCFLSLVICIIVSYFCYGDCARTKSNTAEKCNTRILQFNDNIVEPIPEVGRLHKSTKGYVEFNGGAFYKISYLFIFGWYN